MPWKGIGKRLRLLFQAREFGEEFFEELEDAMIEADMGVRTASEATDALREAVRSRGIKSRGELLAELKTMLRSMIVAREIPLEPEGLNVLLVLGVNGVGKTTTIAKLAHHFRTQQGRGRDRPGGGRHLPRGGHRAAAAPGRPPGPAR